MSLRRRLIAVLLLAGLLAAVGFGVCGWTVSHLVDNKERVTSRYFTAVQLANRHVLAQVDQETGLRGYELSGDITFLMPYREGVGNEFITAQQLTSLLDEEPGSLTALEQSRAAADRWRSEYAEPRIALVRREGRIPLSQAELREGRVRFDDVRSAGDRLETAILQERDQAGAELSSAIRLLVAMLVLAAVGTLVGGVLIWVALKRWVTRPVDAMGADIEVVRNTDLEHVITPAGPSELADLGRAIEQMRRRVVTEYAAALAARAEAEASAKTVADQAVELRRSNRDLEQFAYVASHDLQEPLRKVSSFCQMLQRKYEGQLDERADQYIAFAVDGAKRMQVLINDLLTFSRVGRTTAAFTDVDLQDCFDEAVRVLEPRLTAASATVTADPLPVVRGEASLVTQLFQNLIGNAVKFRGTADPVVHISVSRRATDDADEGDAAEAFELSCADNGIGIEAQYADKIFVIFQRLHTKEEFGGTGIGLALCKKIVEYHGGAIWLDTSSSASPGTTFRWTLPVPEVAVGTDDGGAALQLDLREDGPPADADTRQRSGRVTGAHA